MERLQTVRKEFLWGMEQAEELYECFWDFEEGRKSSDRELEYVATERPSNWASEDDPLRLLWPAESSRSLC
jgi:hypothetical protein